MDAGYPIESFREPEDFSSFWKERMAEADAVPLSWELVPASEVTPAPCAVPYDLWFRGMRGAQLYAKVLVPTEAFARSAPLPLLMRFHGYPGRTRSWLENASWAAEGMILVSMDNPGQGGRSEDVGGFPGTTVAGHVVLGLEGEPKDLYYVRLQQDIRILFRVLAAEPRLAHAQTFVYGDSQGGGVGLAAAALNPEVAAAGILYPFLSDFRKVMELGADAIAYEGLRYWARWFDADGAKAEEALSKLAYIDTASFAPYVQCPVLFGTGLADEICPPATQDTVYERLQCPKRRLFYPAFGHEEIQAFDDALIAFFGKEGL
ncbi:MAG: acetylxylan esterase [Atopobiaceae bacterium]|nr:acetylxylan esterase [Atopobiaceae bacterium]